MSVTLIFLVITLALIIFLAIKPAVEPGKLMIKLGTNSLLGLSLLWLVNLMGNYLGFSIPLNPFTVLVTGFLGLPGLTMLGLLEIVVR